MAKEKKTNLPKNGNPSVNDKNAENTTPKEKLGGKEPEFNKDLPVPDRGEVVGNKTDIAKRIKHKMASENTNIVEIDGNIYVKGEGTITDGEGNIIVKKVETFMEMRYNPRGRDLARLRPDIVKINGLTIENGRIKENLIIEVEDVDGNPILVNTKEIQILAQLLIEGQNYALRCKLVNEMADLLIVLDGLNEYNRSNSTEVTMLKTELRLLKTLARLYGFDDVALHNEAYNLNKRINIE